MGAGSWRSVQSPWRSRRSAGTMKRAAARSKATAISAVGTVLWCRLCTATCGKSASSARVDGRTGERDNDGLQIGAGDQMLARGVAGHEDVEVGRIGQLGAGAYFDGWRQPIKQHV